MNVNPTIRAKEIISDILYITIATSSLDGKPWNTPVYSAFDEEYNFYWGSDINSQHSQNILKNPHVFIVIYNSLAQAGEGQGVYMKAVSSEIKDLKEIKKAFNLLNNRKEGYPWRLKELDGSKRQRLFKAIPETFWMNSDFKADGSFVDVRTEIKLF